MKKIIAMLLALVMLLSLAACAGTAKTDTAAPADDTSKTAVDTQCGTNPKIFTQVW